MATLKQLHELIHALDKNEKKFLSLMIDGVSGKAKARYTGAFKIINSSKEFDPDKLKEKLSKDLAGMNLSEANTNFYNFMCKSILAYQSFDNGNIGTQKELILVDVLISKGLFETAYQMLQPLIVKLKKSGTYAMQHRAFELRSNITINYRKLAIDYETRYQHYAERLNIIDEYRQAVEVTMLNTQFIELAQRTGDPRTENQLKEFIAINQHPLLKLSFTQVSTRVLGTFVALKLALKSIAETNESIADIKQEARKEIYKRLNKDDAYLQDSYLIDFIIAEAIHLKRKEVLTECISELHQLCKVIHHKGQQQKMLTRILMAELTLCLWDKDFAKAEKTIAEWMTDKKKELWIDASLSYINLLLMARLLYMAGKPDKALDYLIMLNDFEKILRPTVHISYRFLFLLCHYKLKHYQFLASATESLYRLLLKQDKLYAPEKALLNFVKKCDHFDTIKTQLQELQVTFNTLENDPLNRPFFAFGDYKEWLGAEIKERKK